MHSVSTFRWWNGPWWRYCPSMEELTSETNLRCARNGFSLRHTHTKDRTKQAEACPGFVYSRYEANHVAAARRVWLVELQLQLQQLVENNAWHRAVSSRVAFVPGRWPSVEPSIIARPHKRKEVHPVKSQCPENKAVMATGYRNYGDTRPPGHFTANICPRVECKISS